MKNVLCFLLISFAFLAISSSSAFADGSPVTAATITKTVLNPTTDTYVKTLSISDAVYHPNDAVTFHITVQNTGSQVLPQVVVRDTLPVYTRFVSGPGSLDKKNNILSFLLYNLMPHTTQSFAVTLQVVNANQFPGNQEEFCLSNKASMTFGANQTHQDIAQFCVANTSHAVQQATQTTTKGGQPVFPPSQTKITPSTGPSTWMLSLLASFAGLGFFVLRKTNIKI